MKTTIFFAVLTFLLSINALGQAKDSTVKQLKDGEELKLVREEVEPSFPGGAKGFSLFLRNNLDMNVPEKNGAPDGTYTVVIGFTVSKDGAVKNCVAETRHGYGMEAEVIKVLKKSPDWIPGQRNGSPMEVYRRQPVTFVVAKK